MRSLARRALGAVASLLALTGLPYLVYLGLYVSLRPSGSPADKQPVEPTVSVVLPTYNEQRIVESKLEDILSLDYPMEKVEVVVVDSSDDRTPELVREFFESRSTPALTLLHDDERRGVASAVNWAVREASGDFVFRTDADSRLAPDVLREAVANLADPSVGAVTGRQTEVLGNSEVETSYRGLIEMVQAVESRLDSTFICHGPCFAFQRDVFESLPEDAVADDTAIGVAIRRAGKRVVMDPALRFTESSVSTFGKRRARKDRRALGLLQLLLRHRDALGRHGLYGLVVLPFNWWFMIVSPWLLAAAALGSSLVAVLLAGPLGVLFPVGVAGFVWLGGRDALGPLQAPYAVFDSQVSLFLASIRLLRGEADGVWEIDRESREAFK
jgi:cellulose synthase/poly-beta-1,6-N-acetylglucosamine synthase-like glycosyltransferase